MADSIAPILATLMRALPARGLSDERLAALATAGDPRAFTAIYQRHHGALYRYCLSLVGNPEDARDGLQSTMEHALAALRRAPLEGLLRPWLYRIAHNESITLIRRRQPAPGELPERSAPAIEQPERRFALREEVGELLRDLRGLSERQRSVLVMHELGGLPYAEIGSVLGVSPGAARQAALEARWALAELGRGREEDCEGVRRTLADGDGRARGTRRLRGHLMACPSCTDFSERLEGRRRVLALIPPPTAATAAAVLQGLLGGGAAATGGAALVPVTLKAALAAVGAAAAAFGTIHELPHVIKPPAQEARVRQHAPPAAPTPAARAAIATHAKAGGAGAGTRAGARARRRHAEVHRVKSSDAPGARPVAHVKAPHARHSHASHGPAAPSSAPPIAPATAPVSAPVASPSAPASGAHSPSGLAALLAAQRAAAGQLALAAAQRAMAAAQQAVQAHQAAAQQQIQAALAAAHQQVQSALSLAQQLLASQLGGLLSGHGVNAGE